MRHSIFAAFFAVAVVHCAGDGERAESSTNAVTSGRIIIRSNANGSAAAPAAAAAVPVSKWGYDIKQDGRSRALKGPLVKEIFVDIGMNMLRVPVRASDAHPSAGVVVAEGYAEDVAAIARVKEAKPGVAIFASVKQIGLSSFPAWVMSNVEGEGEGVDGAKYTRLIEDYLLYMKGAGVTVDWLGVDNERLFNGGNITPAKYNQIVGALKEWCPANNIATPGFIAPEDYGPGFDTDWLRDLWDNTPARFSHVDKIGVHIYSKHRDDSYLAKMLALTNNLHGKGLWDSELHWNDLNDDGVHFDELKLGMLTAFDHFDQGYEALSWWAFQPRSTGTKSAFIMSELVQSTLGAELLPTDDLDGAPVAMNKLNSRAFRNAPKRITLWVANYKEDRTGQWTEIPNNDVASATFVQWSPTSPPEGAQGTAALPTTTNRAAFAMSYPSNSITRVAITLR